jgi:hypothetical protein
MERWVELDCGCQQEAPGVLAGYLTWCDTHAQTATVLHEARRLPEL